jgi:hypothetical protein
LIGHVDNVYQVSGEWLTRCSSQLLRELLVHYRQDQRQVRQWRKIQNQTRCLHDQLHIKLFGFCDSPVRRHHRHLTGVHRYSSFGMTCGIKGAYSFQDHKFYGWARCKKSSPTGHRRGDSSCFDLDRVLVGRHLQKDSAARQLKFTRTARKTENRVCAEPRYREISESQFCARFHAGAHRRPQDHFIVHHRRTWSGMSFQQPYVLNYLGHTRLV